MAQQTAVEWLLYNLLYHNLVDNSPKSKLWELTKQAKEMEKEQIIDSYGFGYQNGYDDSKLNIKVDDAEQYYNETYGGKKP